MRNKTRLRYTQQYLRIFRKTENSKILEEVRAKYYSIKYDYSYFDLLKCMIIILIYYYFFFLNNYFENGNTDYM